MQSKTESVHVSGGRTDASESMASRLGETGLLSRHLAVQFLRTAEEAVSGSPLYRQQLENIGVQPVAYSEDRWHVDAQRIYRSLTNKSHSIDLGPREIEAAHNLLVRGLAAHESMELDKARAYAYAAATAGRSPPPSGVSGNSLEFAAQSDSSTPVIYIATPNKYQVSENSVLEGIIRAATAEHVLGPDSLCWAHNLLTYVIQQRN